MKRGRIKIREGDGGRENRRRKKARLVKVFLFIIAVAVLPFTVSMVVQLPLLFRSYSFITTQMLWVISGFVLFILVFTVFGAPVKSYILEHELSHVVFALISGVRIRSVSMKSSNAYVRTDHTNILIALAPYSLPLYTVILIALYRLVSFITSSTELAALFNLLFGATLSFHFIATVYYIQLEQPDLRRYGYFASMIFIATWSLLILTVILRFIFVDIQFAGYVERSLRETHMFYVQAGSLFNRFFLDKI